MFPKRLFTPKCLYVDRELVFKRDLEDFCFYVKTDLITKTEETNQDIEQCTNATNIKINIITNNIVTENQAQYFDFSYTKFKQYWKQRKMSMLHFAKSKEENTKEYYEELFGEAQSK